MSEENWMNPFLETYQLGQVIQLNDVTEKFGISISKEDALLLMKDRKDSLKETRRVEFGEGILPRLITTFCDSPYIYQENFVEVMGRLQDIFYEYKNEAMDELTDDELIDFMRQAFDGECQGSPDYLEETILEEFARNIRVSGQNFLSHYYRVRETEDE